MRTYTPDLWIIIRVRENATAPAIYKVLGSWYGGFAGSDSWRISSEVQVVVERPDGVYEMHNESGSVYQCPKGAQGISSYSRNVLEGIRRDAAAVGAVVEPVEGLPSELPLRVADSLIDAPTRG